MALLHVFFFLTERQPACDRFSSKPICSGTQQVQPLPTRRSHREAAAKPHTSSQTHSDRTGPVSLPRRSPGAGCPDMRAMGGRRGDTD